jgi:hypothetical protein
MPDQLLQIFQTQDAINLERMVNQIPSADGIAVLTRLIAQGTRGDGRQGPGCPSLGRVAESEERTGLAFLVGFVSQRVDASVPLVRIGWSKWLPGNPAAAHVPAMVQIKRGLPLPQPSHRRGLHDHNGPNRLFLIAGCVSRFGFRCSDRSLIWLRRLTVAMLFHIASEQGKSRLPNQSAFRDNTNVRPFNAKIANMFNVSYLRRFFVAQSEHHDFRAQRVPWGRGFKY